VNAYALPGRPFKELLPARVADPSISRENHRVTYLVEFPVDGGGTLLVQASAEELPGGLELAASPGEVVSRARESVEHAFDKFKPAIGAVVKSLHAMAPDEFAVEFGIALSAESGVIIAKGSADVHFTVTLSWKRGNDKPAPSDDEAGAASPGDPG
jgi:Trypsin-co-occurring domain 1